MTAPAVTAPAVTASARKKRQGAGRRTVRQIGQEPAPENGQDVGPENGPEAGQKTRQKTGPETVQEVVEKTVDSRRAERLREVEARRREHRKQREHRRQRVHRRKHAERQRKVDARREARLAEIETERAERRAGRGGSLEDAEGFAAFEDDVEDAIDVSGAQDTQTASAGQTGDLTVLAETRPAPAERPKTTLTKAPPPSRPAEPVTPFATPKQMRAHVSGRRSRLPLILSFLLMVALPGGFAVHYLFAVAVDRFHSVTAFSVRSEDASTLPEIPLPIPTGITGALDADILNEFIRSQALVEILDRELDLRSLYNRYPQDWVFSLGEQRSIEDLVEHWAYMVDVTYDITTSILEVRAHAFTPEDAHRITVSILRESSALVNRLSQQARDDKIGFAKTDLEEAEARLKEIRLSLRMFRNQNQTADPTQDVEVQMGVINALQQQLAEALIARAEILDVSRPNDPRVGELNRRIQAVETQIELEKDKLGSESDERALADRIGAFEELTTDLEFAEEAYKIAKAAFDQARIEARRQTRYLAAHIEPTLSQAPQYPERAFISALLLGALFTLWGVSMLVWYNVYDRR
ncbi:MAG: sugar transporter [Pseudomonadota bacterium]